MNDDTLNDTATILPFKPKVVTPEVTAAPDPDIVRMFERMLLAAKAGRVRFGAVAVVDERGVAITTWEPNDSSAEIVTQALGAVAFLNVRFANAANDGGDYTDTLKN